MDFSFPYPTQGTKRESGQGCKVCVHQTYCPALYWFRRGSDSMGFRQEPVNDSHMGIACNSWSDDLVDKGNEANQRDLEEVEYIAVQGIGSEANRSGIVDPVTGGDR